MGPFFILSILSLKCNLKSLIASLREQNDNIVYDYLKIHFFFEIYYSSSFNHYKFKIFR
jgi:hypothetical protein